MANTDILNPAPYDSVSPSAYVTYFTQSKGFLEFVANKFQWEDLNQPIFMEIGCGSPKYFLAQYVLARFPDTISVVSIDNDWDIISLISERKVPDKRVSFFYGDIGFSDSLGRWMGKIDKILSMNCFQEVKQQNRAFANVFSLLKPGGEAGISFCLRSGYAAWHCLLSFFKWKPYCKITDPKLPVTQACPPTEEHYEEMVLRLGFEIVYISREEVQSVFPTEGDWKGKVLKQALKTFDIPDEDLSEFKSDLYRLFENQNPRDCGLHCEHSYYMMVLVRKPMIPLL